jgi:hypothetical protein
MILWTLPRLEKFIGLVDFCRTMDARTLARPAPAELIRRRERRIECPMIPDQILTPAEVIEGSVSVCVTKL